MDNEVVAEDELNGKVPFESNRSGVSSGLGKENRLKRTLNSGKTEESSRRLGEYQLSEGQGMHYDFSPLREESQKLQTLKLGTFRFKPTVPQPLNLPRINPRQEQSRGKLMLVFCVLYGTC